MSTVQKTKSLRWFTREWREMKGLSQDQVAERLDTNRGQISKLERGDLRMNDDWIAGISSALDIDPAALFRDPNINPDKRSKIPMITWVSAGAFQAADTIMDISDFPTIDIAGLPEGDWFALKVEGDSMDRISPPGSVIAVNRDEKQLIPNRCYVIANEEGEVTYKRYRSSPDRFEPVSVNTTHETLFPNGSVRVIGRVVRSIYDL